ncbi:MAG TPA: carbohydrate ABC transporter permease [Chloroflexota bacterium]|nr:carbohydrate ABC transporter permease [Chloroflexota bacterium]
MASVSAHVSSAWLRRGRKRLDPGHWLAVLVLLAVIILCVFPFWWTIASSFKTAQEILVGVPKLFPRSLNMVNYDYILNFPGINYVGMFVNSVYVTGFTVILYCFLCVTAGFGFARVEFRGRDAIFLALVLLLFVPQAGGLIALYEMMDKIGLRNNLNGLVLYFASQITVGTFIMRQAFLNMPRELEDSARIDGANTFQVLWYVAVPMVTSAVLVITILEFVQVWGEFLVTYTLIDNQQRLTAAVGYAMVASSVVTPQMSISHLADLSIYGTSDASAVILLLPAVLIYIALQKWFVQGMLEGILKF